MSSILHCITRKLSVTRGCKRYWEENKTLLTSSGFGVGDKFSISYSKGRVELHKDPNGTNTVSKKKQDNPVLDLTNRKLSECFEDVEDVLIELYHNKIIITLTNLASKAAKRLNQIKTRLKKGAPVALASLFMGISGLDHSVAYGLEKSGVPTRLAWGNEIDTQMMELSLQNNPVWSKGAKSFACPIQEFNPESLDLEAPDILLAGLPCIGHSSMQTNPKKRGVYHPTAGLLFIDFLRVVHQSNPAIILIEQSPNFIKHTDNPKDFGSQHADFYCITRYLQELGYTVSYKKVNGHDHGCLEKRVRTLMVATTKGVDFDLPSIQVNPVDIKPLGHYLTDFEQVPSSGWSLMPYLSAKSAEKTNNFGETLVDEDSTTIPVFTATYAKRQPNTPIIKNKTNPTLKRLATPEEHARIKGLPEWFVAGASQTLGHKALGNSVQKPVFEYYGYQLGLALQAKRRVISCPPDKPLPEPMTTTSPKKLTSLSESQLTLFS